ncbi:MAG: LLM class F420-dependent oxidoreductase [Mycobacterium sp.]|nr:LLM class F420-dependent oxidoreductase [Mycobacterium sp.]TAM67415.1 MAG: LLM class F420-dependent oxidoreductase [Mycobacterium sp.]
MDLGKVGVWAAGLRFADPGATRACAAELEELGFTALWLPGGANPGTLDAAQTLLDATRSIPIATGIVNIWMEDATDLAAQAARIQTTHPSRLLLGVGVSHGPVVGEQYHRPLAAMRDYLDRLDGAPVPVPIERRIIAAIGQRMLALARERAGGSHPYLMPPEHTHRAREALGSGKLLAPEQTVVLETDSNTARAAGRQFLATYMQLPNYADNWRRVLGFDDTDFADGGSDRLVDALIAWGDEETVLRRVEAHLHAGADHVCIQVAAPWDHVPMEELRRLSAALVAKGAD